MAKKDKEKTNKYLKEFSERTAESFQEKFPEIYQLTGNYSVFDQDFIYENSEKPRDPDNGWYAFPVFKYKKLLSSNPLDTADAIVKSNVLKEAGLTYFCVATMGSSGYVSFLPKGDFPSDVISSILNNETEYGSSDEGAGKKILVEYSSPNIAKPFGVGHLRSTVIGNSLRLIFAKLGYDTVGINFLGDWGTQFGKMIVAYRKWGEGKAVGDFDIKELLALYVKFHEEAKTDKSLDDDAREAFRKLELGEKEETALWTEFKNISNTEFDRIYKILGVDYDWVTSESFLNDKMDSAIDRFEKAKLTSISEGAEIIDLGDEQLPPVLLRKTDGATLYATRDLAGLMYRWKEYDFHESLYIVGSAQSDHFSQAFKAIALLEEAENLDDDKKMSGRVKHIPFGWVRFGNKSMSTRQGNIIILEEVLKEAVQLVAKKMQEKNPDLIGGLDLSNPENNIEQYPQVAQDVGVGAVIFSQLSVRRQKDVNFTYENVLNFEGETGPYLQYTHARLSSLLTKCLEEMPPDIGLGFLNEPTEEQAFESSQIEYFYLDNAEEKRILEILFEYQRAISDAAKNYEPYMIIAYLNKLTSAFNSFYQRKTADGKSDKIIDETNPERTKARIALVKCVQIVLKDGLGLIGLKSPEKM